MAAIVAARALVASVARQPRRTYAAEIVDVHVVVVGREAVVAVDCCCCYALLVVVVAAVHRCCHCC